MRRFALLTIALVVPLAAGCGGGDEGGQSGGGGGKTVGISARDFAFAPSKITVPAGTVTFDLTNDGKATHALEIEGNGVEEESDEIGPGESTKLTVKLDDGEYEIYCPVDGHKERGMTGTVTVGGGAAGGAGTTEDETETGESNDGSGY